MKKLFIILFCIITLSGCNIYYSFNIDESLNITESINFRYDNMSFEGTSAVMTEDDFINLKNSVKRDAEKYNYKIIDNTVDNNINYTLKRITSFSNFSTPVFLEGKYENFITKCNDSTCSLTASSIENEFYGDGNIVNYSISISLPFEVIRHNALSFDEKSNTYYWFHSPLKESRNIEIIFNKDGDNVVEEYETKVKTKSYLWIIIGVSILSILSFVGIKVYRANKYRL
jgi:hypothetical protein